MMKTTCYKCGREIEGTRAIGLWPICPECESLEVLKDINSKNKSDKCSGHGGGGGGYGWIDNQKVEDFLNGMMWQKIQYDYMPKWSTYIMCDERRFNTAMLCLFFGAIGGHLFYMKRWLPVAIFLAMLAVLSGCTLSCMLFPFFALFSIIYFSMDDQTFRIKCLPKEETTNFFKAQLCLYNLVKFGQKIPGTPPESFADCIMSYRQISECKSVLSDYMAGEYFKKEMLFFKDFEEHNGMSYQEGYLINIMEKFPKLKGECENAINKIHFTRSFVDWKRKICS